MRKTLVPINDLDIPAALLRTTNDRGISLSAGISATGSRVAEQEVDQTTQSEPVSVPAVVSKADAKRHAKAAAKLAREIEVAAKREARAAAKAAKAAPVEPEATAPALSVPEPVISAEDGQPLVKISRSIVPMKFKARYAKNNGVCGDDVSLELKAATTKLNEDKRETLDVETLWAIAAANGIDVTKYLPLNNGQKRMNVGNKLRGRLNAGKDVVIGARTFLAEDFTPRA